jgi:magnesium-transporting ATPase (P-type)
MFPEKRNSHDTVALRRRFDFNSALMRSSSVVSCSNSNRAFIKGAPEKVRELCIGEIPSNFDAILEEYTKNGYRVIALAHKELSADLSLRIHSCNRDEIEHGLTFLGFLIMENRLKPESTGVLSNLKECEINSIMATGDNVLTAISVARQCHIIDD